jgi:hypothetical protein
MPNIYPEEANQVEAEPDDGSAAESEDHRIDPATDNETVRKTEDTPNER